MYALSSAAAALLVRLVLLLYQACTDNCPLLVVLYSSSSTADAYGGDMLLNTFIALSNAATVESCYAAQRTSVSHLLFSTFSQ